MGLCLVNQGRCVNAQKPTISLNRSQIYITNNAQLEEYLRKFIAAILLGVYEQFFSIEISTLSYMLLQVDVLPKKN